jgi:hypothetical protein
MADLFEQDLMQDPMQEEADAESQPLPDMELTESVGTEEQSQPETQERGPSGYPPEVEAALIALDDFFAKEDEGMRNNMLSFWKKLENYFGGIQRIFWDFDAEEWRGIDLDNLDPSMYDKIINIYRAHGEAIIAALSIKLPNVNFLPDDADEVDDINTANAYSKISELISRHNNGILIFIKALFILFNQGVCAAYIYNRKKNDYGTVDVPEYGDDVSVVTHTLTCPVCQGYIREFQDKKPASATQGAQPPQPGINPEAPPNTPAGAPPQSMNTPGTFQQPPNAPPPPMPEMGGMQPPLPGMEEMPQLEPCPNCGAEVEPEDNTVDETFPQIVGYTKEAKSRTIIDVFGPMYAHMPFYARHQEHMPYIRLRFEQHFSLIKAMYENLRDKVVGGTDSQNFDREVRAWNNLDDAYSTNLVTTTCAWYRPWAYEVLDLESVKKLKEYFPDGVYFVKFKNNIAEARNEKLDEHWEVTYNPFSNFIHADPMGKPLAPLQEIRNEITDLALDTFEHSIPETFVDTGVLDFDAYQKSQARPGMKYPVKMPMGRGLADAFYTDKPAMMSDEMKEFRKAVDLDAQFVTGSFPSIYGGPATGGSKTAKEYSESRAMALQRLNTTWSMLKHWWANIMSKAIPLYIDALVDDEKFVKKEGYTGFTNVWIRQAELSGKVGRVEPEANEELPSSFAQYKGILMELITLNNDAINQAVFNPQNTQNVARVLGWPEFYIPGQDDRDKQYGEISEILQGMEVTPEIGVDDDMVHLQTTRSWAVSPTGIATKKSNPEGYMKVVAHGKAHMDNMIKMREGNAFSQPGEPSPSNADTAVE